MEDKEFLISKYEQILVKTTDPRNAANGKQACENEHGKAYQNLVRLGARMQIKRKYRGR